MAPAKCRLRARGRLWLPSPPALLGTCRPMSTEVGARTQTGSAWAVSTNMMELDPFAIRAAFRVD